MKKLLLMLCAMVICTIAHADTFNQYWYNESVLHAQTSCQTGGDINLPAAPTKYGYDFVGWEKLPLTQLKYLESTGTQWIDTGVIAKSSIKAEFVVDRPVPPAISDIGEWSPLTSMNDQTNGSFRIFEYTNSYSKKYIAFTYGMTSVSEVISESWVDNEFNQSKFVLDAGILTVDNGAQTITSPQAGQTFNSGHNLRLFLSEGKTSSANCTMYYLKLWDGNTLIRDFIPVLDQNGTPCMFDRVEGKFYYNQGTGQFVAGPVLTE